MSRGGTRRGGGVDPHPVCLLDDRWMWGVAIVQTRGGVGPGRLAVQGWPGLRMDGVKTCPGGLVLVTRPPNPGSP